MILIGENIHVISKAIRENLVERDEDAIRQLIDMQKNMDYIDLNVGPSKGKLEGVLAWLVNVVGKNKNISFDTTNVSEMQKALDIFDGKNSFINSVSLDEEKLDVVIDMALKHDSNLIALTLSKETGIPKTCDGRLEIAYEIYERCLEKGINSEKLFFDPLILPINIDQSQGVEALNTIKMIKEGFDPPVKTVIGLSNISNGCPKEIRSLINRVFACLAFGAGIDALIIDAQDLELVRILKMLESGSCNFDVDKLYLNLANMISEFGELDDVEFDENSRAQVVIMKTAKVLLNREIYSNSFTQI